MRQNVVFLLAAMMPMACMGDELPPTIKLPTQEVTTEVESATSTITTVQIIDTIKPGVWYVIRSKTPLFVLDSPQGSVTIISGATGADGIFSDGDGTPESRVFDPTESTFLIQGLKPCKTELILIPVGLTEKKGIFRQLLTVTGEAPKPPPEPDPDEPDKPPVPEPVKSFRVIWIVESGKTLNHEQTAIPGAKAVRDYLDAKTTGTPDGQKGWRKYDPQQITANEVPVFRELWKQIKKENWTVPCVAIEVNSHTTILPLPADTDEALELLKQYGGK